MRLEITTPCGKHYVVHENGNIAANGVTPSGDWRLIALVHVNRREIIPFPMLLAGKLPSPLLYKNGNPQWTVRDFDHGTIREWGNTRYHGVKSIRLVKGT